MTVELLLGDEAVALGALDAGIGGAFSYPGTPATEIFEFIERRTRNDSRVVARWSANEKVAYEEAMGMSFVGKRALVSMKHVGLNVAADPFMSSALTGANGGLVLAIADDPGMHSSQNEQDSRFYADFAQIPLFEPGDQQESYDVTRTAFEVSEHFGLPIVVRLVTRLAHSRSRVQMRQTLAEHSRGRVRDWQAWTLLPSNARKRFGRLLDLQEALRAYSQRSDFNRLTLRGSRGVILAGVARNYFNEAVPADADYSVLKLAAYPVPRAMVRELVDHCTQITVIEEGYPFIERQLVGLLGVSGKAIRGKLDGVLPPQGELTTDIVRMALGLSSNKRPPVTRAIPPRPPQLCDGCPHCDTYRAVIAAAAGEEKPYLFGDIGCYTLAAFPPYSAIDACVDMGASIGMAIGAAKAGAHPVIATIGDSTFIHSGMSALVGAAHDDLNMTVVILDNALIAMTGGQEVLATGEDLIRVVRGLGVDERHIVQLRPVPTDHQKNVEFMRKEIEHRGLSVIVTQRECIHAKRRARDESNAPIALSCSAGSREPG